MNHYHYEIDRTFKAVAFKIYDRRRGSMNSGETVDTHVAHCRDRDDAERIVAALNAISAPVPSRGVFG